MANEILALECDNDQQGALFLFPITTPKQIGGVNVVPTPSSLLPPLAAASLTTGEKAALDDGTAAFAVRSFKMGGATPAQVLAAVRASYAAALADFQADYAARYAYAGQRFNA